MSDTYSYIPELVDKLSLYNISINEEKAKMLIDHLSLVLNKNKVINLTRIDDLQSGINKHIVDSLLIVAALQKFTINDCFFIDIGTGAGYPGIPINIVNNWNGILIDSVKKKINAVNEFIDVLNLKNLHTCHSRIEDYSKNNFASSNLVVARAVAEMSTLIEYASPLLKKNGYLVITKGTPKNDEIEHASTVSSICGLKLVSRETYELPDNCGKRNIYIYKKISKSSIKLPRDNKTMKKLPLYN